MTHEPRLNAVLRDEVDMGFRLKAVVSIAALSLGAAACAASADTDRQAFVDAIKPTRTKPPVVAVLALNEGTETTDFLVPHAVLQRAGVASVEAVAPRRGRVVLMPALEVEVQQDLAAFDLKHPAGADYVVVPAMHVDDDPAILGWLRAQAAKGAVVIGICSGALVVGQAGLLDGRRFTGHWYDRSDLLKRHPTASHVPNQRYLADRRVATTTGISASVPVTLALVEAIGGAARAKALAAELGLESWGPEHDSAPFKLSVGGAWTVAMNSVAFWRHEQVGIVVRDGTDDIQLAFAADAWSRTYRSSAIAVADTAAPIRLHSGFTLFPAAASATKAGIHRLTLPTQVKPAQQLDRTLCEIGRRYGAATREWVAIEMEYRIGDRLGGECAEATAAPVKTASPT
jgi:putative intracellular protease/amidase